MKTLIYIVVAWYKDMMWLSAIEGGIFCCCGVNTAPNIWFPNRNQNEEKVKFVPVVSSCVTTSDTILLLGNEEMGRAWLHSIYNGIP